MFECTSCGAQMRFDPGKGKLVCGFCKNILPVAEHPDEVRFREGNAREARHSGTDVTIFTCPQCGGEIMSMENQATEFCTYCGASVTLEGRLSETNYPKKIVPFYTGKEEVKEKYRTYLSSLHFVPPELKSPDFQEKFCGIYMPFWSYKVSQKGPAVLKGVRTRGKTTEYCDVKVDLDTVYDDLCFDASSSFDDTLSNGIRSSEAMQLRDFSPAYLMGFYADIPDVDSSVYEEDARQEANDRTISLISMKDSNMSGMSFSDRKNKSDEVLHTKVEEAQPVLLPVWFLTWRNKGKKGDRVSYAVVNGSKGNMKAEVPVDLKKCLMLAGLITIPLSILLFLILPAMMPETAMMLSAFLLMLTMNLYEGHMAELLRREAHLDDIGYLSKKKPEKMEKSRRKRKKKGALKAVLSLILMLLAYVLVDVVFAENGLSLLGHLISGIYTAVADNISTIMAVAVLTGVISSVFKFRKICSATPDKETLWQSMIAYAVLACAAVIFFLKPVSDLFYYGGMILIVGGMLVLLYALLERFNLRCSHEVPNFLDRKEAE